MHVCVRVRLCVCVHVLMYPSVTCIHTYIHTSFHIIKTLWWLTGSSTSWPLLLSFLGIPSTATIPYFAQTVTEAI